jgi:hypothetical protein
LRVPDGRKSGITFIEPVECLDGWKCRTKSLPVTRLLMYRYAKKAFSCVWYPAVRITDVHIQQ